MFINVIAIDIVYICNGNVSCVQSPVEIYVGTEENVLSTKNYRMCNTDSVLLT